MMLTILLMACITFFTRYLFLHQRLGFKVGPKMQQFLSFSAPAVLTAIWVPIIFINEDGLNLNWHNPYLSAAIVAIIVFYIFCIIDGLYSFTGRTIIKHS